MNDALIGKQHENLARTGESTVIQIAQEVWAAQKLLSEPLNKQSNRHLPGLEIVGDLSSERAGKAKAPHIEPAKDQLLKKLAESFDKNALDGFVQNMNSFEARAASNQLNPQEVTETYKQFSRILSVTGREPLTEDQRKQVVKESLRHCANPEIISQGQHSTCNVTAVQARAYTLHPSKASKLIADIVTTGEYTTPTRIHVKLDKLSMVPDREARNSQPEQGKRDYATQLFNLAAVNVWYGAAKPNWHYQQRIERNDRTHSEHVVERVVDLSGGEERPVLYPGTKSPLDGPTLGADQIAFINDAIVGKHEPYAVLTWGTGSVILPGVKEQAVHAKDIIEESRFQSILQELKDKHQLPAIASVETGVYPLSVDKRSDVYGYDNGGHVVNIADFTGGKKPHVAIDNEWSRKEDHLDNSVSLHDMYLCIGGAKMARLDAVSDIMMAETEGKLAPVAEMTRLAKDAEGGVDSQYARIAGQKVIDLAASSKALSGEERTKWYSQLSVVVGSTRPEDKSTLLGKIQISGACTEMELGFLVASAAKSINYQKRQAWRDKDVDRQLVCTKATTQIAEFVVGLPTEVKKHYVAKLREND